MKKYLALRMSNAGLTYLELAANIIAGTCKVVKITDASGTLPRLHYPGMFTGAA